jgi:uncharacterized membrane protein
MRSLVLACSLVASLSLAACGDTTTSRSLSGAAIGAAGGAAIGAIAGSPGVGAAIGAGAGLLGGYLYDQHQKGNID